MRRVAVLLMVLLSACSNKQLDRQEYEVYRNKPPKAFASDGCTLALDLNFRKCCEDHDLAYWCGGTKAQRKEADQVLKTCIKDKNHPKLAHVYYRTVRMLGLPYFPTYWRWGFGWPGQYNYDTKERQCEHSSINYP